ncbi:PTS glucitol/sorbitol transporter subunit IIA [Xylocopilactobacillus apicola]|uniref:PTS sorbitol transporter subunit IIA n=1 Tax=Xylocopilactobacillus apicola TaxID=2932184 RepID=A0AAU9DBM8_9LACO|nr:PTS glucitol/sorbitol transporter subunit IIA [Xylocopilactobacillus apicola]BDR58217.1 PTS sorbitol transporter subunit IIA [Xylocopilactobacillus apicola]
MINSDGKKAEKTIFSTQVKEIGTDAKEFKEIKMMILFGDEAPDALRSSCYIIDLKPVAKEIEKDMILKIDDNSYPITAVGNEVQRNLTNLGHIAISFTGASSAELPGTLYVEDHDYPEVLVGSRVSICQK